MPEPIRLTSPTIAVLNLLLSAASDDLVWGLEICRGADLGTGTVYPILDRLTRIGWIEPHTESEPHPGRPARRYYTLTATGRRAATGALAQRAQRRPFGLRPTVAGGQP